MAADDAQYHELSAYTLERADAAFIHQAVVDAWAVQTATPDDKPIRVAQALVGLFLHVEHHMNGRQVQRVHHLLANRRPDWPNFRLPPARGSMTVGDVVAESPGELRDRAIEAWVMSTWEACRDIRNEVIAFLASNGITPPPNRGS